MLQDPIRARRTPTACLALASLLAACTARHTHAPVAAVQPIGPSYIDLEPGWRLRVVTPILKSGGYRLKLTAQTADAGTVTLHAGDDFLGYEVAYYAVRAHNGVEFVSAETTRNGHTAPDRKSTRLNSSHLGIS